MCVRVVSARFFDVSQMPIVMIENIVAKILTENAPIGPVKCVRENHPNYCEESDAVNTRQLVVRLCGHNLFQIALQ